MVADGRKTLLRFSADDRTAPRNNFAQSRMVVLCSGILLLMAWTMRIRASGNTREVIGIVGSLLLLLDSIFV